MTGVATGPEPSASGPRPVQPDDHAHVWALMQFEFVDGHPVVRQRCETCGLVRRYRAWERYWTPPPTAPSGR